MSRRATALLLALSLIVASVQPGLAAASAMSGKGGPLKGPGPGALARILLLPAPKALPELASLPAGTPEAQAARLIEGLAAFQGEALPSIFQNAAAAVRVSPEELATFVAGLAAVPGFAVRVQSLRQELGSVSSLEGLAQSLGELYGAKTLAVEPVLAGFDQAAAAVARSLLADVIRKYSDIAELAPSAEAAVFVVSSWGAAELEAPLGELLDRLAQAQVPDAAERRTRVEKALIWLRRKYGVLDRPLLSLVGPGAQGSYQTPGTVRFSLGPASLPPAFDPGQESSVQDLDAYIGRKWGGLSGIAKPERVVFSEMGTTDTLAGLRRRGFARFHFVNGPYASRGAKTLLAWKEGESSPHLVFYSFVGRDLLNHKLMQLALQYGESFKAVQVLGSDRLKSWEVADLVVTRALSQLPERRIDDLVVGYGDEVEASLRRHGRELERARVGDFATITYFSVRGKNGLERTVAVLTDVELRYFGKSVLALVKPFLSRGIDRVVFAGSAGSLDPVVPLHGLVIPRGFHALEDSGGVGQRLAIDNDLFDLLPYGQSWSGRHLSVSSPLVESRELVRRLREEARILSVDVEGSQLAGMIARHNAAHGARVRFGAAFLVTDTPVAQGESAKEGYGLHRPDFKNKAEAKKGYAAALALLWGLPDRHKPSHHAKRIGRHYGRRIAALAARRDAVGLAALAREIEDRLAAVEALSRADRRVSRGLKAVYRDLLRAIEKEGVVALAGLPPPEPGVPPRAVAPTLQRAILLQSLTRSSTLSSGEVAFKTELPPAVLRARAAANAERAADYLLARLDWPLELSDILRLNALLNEGIGQEPGRPRDFSYEPEEGSPRGSLEELEVFGEWVATVRPTPEAALEAYLRLEELHPFADANGRVAELVAQHLMLRATGHPFLFPHRFDIDYVLSLRRNGSGPGSDSEQLSRLLRRSAALSAWLSHALPGGESGRAWIDPRTGHMVIALGGARYELAALFKAPQGIELEREERVFLEPGAAFEGHQRGEVAPASVLRLPHAEYELALALYPSQTEPPAAQPGEAGAAPAEGVLNFGGSFSPPTLEHVGILTHLMHRLGLRRAKMVVAYPYKAGAAPPEVSLELAKVAVENLSEALTINGAPYAGFSSWEGGSSWIGAGGKRYAVAVEEYDLRTRNKENALQTLEHLRLAHGGDPKANYWLSGADSFGSVMTWTPRWRELFEHSHWLVVARAGYERLDFKKPDPLRGLFDDEFLFQYRYSFDKDRRMHVYAHKDPRRPGIFIVDQPTLGDSSTDNRESLAEDAEREHAQAGLQPSVFKRAVQKGYYARQGGQPGYTALTEKNLDLYTAQLFDRIAGPSGAPAGAEEASDYERLSAELVLAAKAQARAESGKTWWRRAAHAVVEHLGEFLENILSVPKFRKKLRELCETVGRDVALLYAFGELILEPIIAPIIAFFLGGAAAAAVAPFLHVNELLVMPAYFAYRLARHLRDQRRLAGGELRLYLHLTSYRRRLARGDPEAIVARVELGGGLALGGAAMTLNVVRSQLPKWVPLAIRRFFDRRIVWHDLNVSINELKAALQDNDLAARLAELSGRRRGLLGHRLLAAIQADPAAKARLEIFLAARYFQRLSLGEVDEQLVGGFTPAEREALVSLRAQAEGYRRALLPGQVAELSELAADFYALSRALAAEPARARSDAFWTAFLDMMAARYPDERLSLSRRVDRALLARRLPLLIRMVERALPGALAGAAITYRGRPLAEVRGAGEAVFVEAALERAASAVQGLGKPSTTAAAVRARTLESAAIEYARANAGLFAGAAGTAGLRLLATSSRGDDLDGANLIWEMDLLRNRVERELSVLSSAYARAEKHLEQRRPAKRAARVFWDAREMIEKGLEGLARELRVLEYDWLKLKFPHQVGAAARDERLIEGYAEIAERYQALRGQYEARLDALRALKDMMFGTQPALVEDFEALREAVWGRVGTPGERNLLGYGLLRRLGAHLAGLWERARARRRGARPAPGPGLRRY